MQRCSHTALGWGSKSNNWCPFKEREIWGHRGTEIHREEGPVTTAAETGKLQL